MTPEMKKTIIIFGGLSVVILLLFEMQKWSLFTYGGSRQIYLVISGILFLSTGAFFSRYFNSKIKERKIESLRSKLSKQEIRVLLLVADGYSNREISDQLFIAETTVKSHISNIFSKLKANRRTEAVKIGKEIGLIP